MLSPGLQRQSTVITSAFGTFPVAVRVSLSYGLHTFAPENHTESPEELSQPEPASVSKVPLQIFLATESSENPL